MMDDIDRDCCSGVAKRIADFFEELEGEWKPVEIIQSGDPEQTVILKNEYGPVVSVVVRYGEHRGTG